MSLSVLLLSLQFMAQAPAGGAADAKSCTLRSMHGTPLLLGDATAQEIRMVDESCGALKATNLLLVNSSDSKLRVPITWNGEVIGMTAAIPAPGDADAAVSSTWLLYASEAAMSGGSPSLGQVIMTPITVKIGSKTVVSYPYEDMLTETLAQASKPPGVAYLDPLSPIQGRGPEVMNTAHLDLPDVGPVVEWTVSSPGVTLYNYDARWRPCEGGVCKWDTPQRAIHFAASKAVPAPQWASIKAKRSKGDTFDLRVKLAESVEPSAVPLDLADIPYVRCQKDVRLRTFDVVRNNALAAITNGTATNNRCMLVVSEPDITFAIGRKHGIPYDRHVCPKPDKNSRAKLAAEINELGVTKSTDTRGDKSARAECERLGASRGEVVTLISASDRKVDPPPKARIARLKQLYGEQRVTYFVYADAANKDASRHELVFSATQAGRMEIPLKLDGEAPSPDKPYRIEAYVQPVTAAEELPAGLERRPRQQFSTTLRPKGPFGITHTRGSLGANSFRMFATIPFQFAMVRFPAAGLDIKSTRDSTIAQLATLTTGLLITFEPWDYTRGTNMFAVPWRVQTGMLMSNWTKGVFHPSTYLGAAITLPVFRGTNQLDTDLALGLGWEVDLRPGYDSFGARNHVLLTIGMNLLSLFGPQSAPRGK